MIIVGGENVFAVEVEQVIQRTAKRNGDGMEPRNPDTKHAVPNFVFIPYLIP